jgi:hypothetical protein
MEAFFIFKNTHFHWGVSSVPEMSDNERLIYFSERNLNVIIIKS